MMDLFLSEQSDTDPDDARLGEPHATRNRVLRIGAVGVAAGWAGARMLWPARPRIPLAITLAGCAACASVLSPHWPTMIRRLNDPNGFALTFDDGPHPSTTPAILDTLRRFDTKAAFFLVGEQAKEHPGLVRRIAEDGHTVGVHGWQHRPMTFQSRSTLLADLAHTADVLEEATGVRVRCYRPPWGFRGPALEPVIRHLGWKIIGWRFAGQDWKASRPETVTDHVLRNAHKRDIVLLHDAGPGADMTSTALPTMLEGLLERGMSLVSLDSVL